MSFCGLVVSQACAAESSFQFDFTVSVYRGDVDGYLQTPDGGIPGSSDDKRPEFSELDIDDVTNFDFDIGLQYGANRFYLGGNISRQSESAILTSGLVSQWQTFNAGNAVKTDSQLDWYRIGYLRRFTPAGLARFSFEVGAEVTLFNFHYKLSNGVVDVDRQYNKSGYRLGGRVNYDVNDQFGLNLAVFFPLQFDGATSITTVDLIGRYKVNPGIDVFAGLAYHEIRFKDEQRMPNKVRAEMQPLFRLGLSVAVGR